VGVHTTARLLESGHEVRAMARSVHRLRENLRPFAIEVDGGRVEVVEGDMTDSAAVREAAQGCDLAVHAAATFSYRRRDAKAIRDENVRGTELVLDAAIDSGCRGIVQVSSTVALLRRDGVLDNRSPLGVGIGPYTSSKVESERVARNRQDAGAPVAIVNPGAILGPHDPYLGESNRVVRDVLRGGLPTWPRGSLQFVDVRDVAAVVVAALGRPGGRFLVPGQNVAVPHRLLSEVTGRRLPVVAVPGSALIPALLPGYLTGLPFLPGALEGVRFIASNTTADPSATVTELGITGHPLRETLVDTIRWLVAAGHLSPKRAGRALTSDTD
jgi:nucleoside-diphosphate-sugar epimerase